MAQAAKNETNAAPQNGEGSSEVLKETGPKSVNLFALASEALNKRLADKALLITGARQRLAMVVDTDKENVALVQDEAKRLYDGVITGLVATAEVTAILGDVFGFKSKKDGKPSATPAGRGEEIRKRIVRCVAAYEYTLGEEIDYFAKCEPHEVSAILSEMEDGTSIWTVYDKLGKLESAANEAAAPLSLNPEKLAKFGAELTASGNVHAIRTNPKLIAVYAAIKNAIEEIGNLPEDFDPDTIPF